MNTTTGRKMRSDAKLERLNEAQHELLRGWLEENAYFRVVEFVRQEFGLSVSKSALSVYWRRHMMPQTQEDDAEAVAALLALPATDFKAATLRRVELLAWDAAARPTADADRTVKLFGVVLKAERQALEARRVVVQERRVAVREDEVALRRASRGRGAEAEGGKVGNREIGKVGKVENAGEAAVPRGPVLVGEDVPSLHSLTLVATKGGELADKNVVGEARELPRSPGYSTVIQPQAEAGLGIPKDTKRHEEVGGSAGVEGGGERPEVAAKALSGEGRSEGAVEAEGGKVGNREIGKVENGGEEGVRRRPVAVVEDVPSLHSLTLVATRGDGLPAQGAGSEEDFAGLAGRLEARLDEIGGADPRRLAALAKETYSELRRFKAQYGLGGGG